MVDYRGNTFGRIMSNEEYRMMKKTGKLYSSYEDGLVPVLGCPPHAQKILSTMPTKCLRNFSRQIGIKEADVLAIFEVNPDDVKVTEIPIRNKLGEYGLRECKLENRAPVSIVKYIKL